MSLDGDIQNLKCPYCTKAPLETSVMVPIVERMGLWYKTIDRQMIGCCSCIKKKIIQEAQQSKSKVSGLAGVVIGLFPPSKKSFNLVKKDVAKVRKVLADAGISELPENIKYTDISYSVAIGMIKADGRIDKEEIDTAIRVGKETFPDFDEAEFRKRLNSYKFLPTIEDLSLLLKLLLDEESKEGLIKFLILISAADGDIADEEVKLLKTVAKCLEFGGDIDSMLPKI